MQKIAMQNSKLQKQIRNLPASPGVYLMENARGKVLYVGKAVNLKKRVSQYLHQALDDRLSLMLEQVKQVAHQTTPSVVEALILEANLIKKFQPKFNVKEKDQKSFLYIWISREKFPRIEFIRGLELHLISEKKPLLFGPYPSATQIRAGLDIIRQIFPFRTCNPMPKKACLYYYLGLCPAPCIGKINKDNYWALVKKIKEILEGKKGRIIKQMEKEMKALAKKHKFEEAANLRNKIFALQHIQDVAVIKKEDQPPSFYHRIEAYDVSGIRGVFATGSMVVFVEGAPEKSGYRKFRIKTVKGINDIAMLKEILARRLRHQEWSLPDLIIIDGGGGQVNGASEVLKNFDLKIPVLGIAKGKDRKKDELVLAPRLRLGQAGIIPFRDLRLFKEIRDEAHRFARGYYQKLHREGTFLR